MAAFSPQGGRLGPTALLALNDDVFPRANDTRPSVAFSRHGGGLATWMGDTSEQSGVWVRRVGDAIFCDGLESGDAASWTSSARQPPPSSDVRRRP